MMCCVCVFCVRAERWSWCDVCVCFVCEWREMVWCVCVCICYVLCVMCFFMEVFQVVVCL